jgi:hypothetical protein
MSRKRSELSKYMSPSTGEYCTAAQYIAEIICQRIADKDKVGTLAYKFWNNEKWKKTYIRQVGLANKLVKDWGDEAVVRFIKSKRGSKILSLGMKGIADQIEFFKNSLDNREPSVIIEMTKLLEYTPRKSFGQKNLITKIKEIDHGKNTRSTDI